MVKKTLQDIMARRPDFQREVSHLAKVFVDRGQGFTLSVKCHPECAGKGIEYCWGKGKYEFRRSTNHRHSKMSLLEIDVRVALGPDDFISRSGTQRSAPLPLERCRKFARRARTFRNAYGCYKVCLCSLTLRSHVQFILNYMSMSLSNRQRRKLLLPPPQPTKPPSA